MRMLYLCRVNFNKTILGRAVRRFKIYHIVKDRLFEEHRVVCGLRNRDKTFYLIRPFGETQGLMSIHNYVLWKIRYALEHGYIPVVDLKHYANMYLAPEMGGRLNAWEYYFRQPTEYTVEDVLHSRNVIVCDKHLDAGYSGMDDIEEILLFHGIIEKYCRLNDNMNGKVMEAMEILFPKNQKVLGVLGRGSDYTSTCPGGHNVVPSIDLLIQMTDEKLQEWGYDFVYLATEDKEIYDAMKKHYGQKLIALDVPRFAHDTNKKRLSELNFERENDQYLRGEEYLITIYLLSHCDSIITSGVGGGLAALRINGGKYEHQYIFNLGRYQ